jgi:predicted NAD/FAD-binding protein
VSGGSWSYVKAFTQEFTGTIRLQAGVERLYRTNDGVRVESAGQPPERYDQVVIATHADQALRLLGDPTLEEKRLLGPWRYEANSTVLHTDLSVLPSMSRAWSCWNFRREKGKTADQPVYLTYSMNLLQGLTTQKHYLVTLNRPGDYDESQVIARMVYHHPTYTVDSMATQSALPTLNGVNRTYFCGSYFGYGFHEDAVRSSVQAIKLLQEQE